MSDPLERLRGGSSGEAPSVDVIRSRARRIQRRRYVAVASSAAIVVALAGVGLFVRTNPTSTKEQQTRLDNHTQAFAPVATVPVPAAGAGTSAGTLEKAAATSAPSGAYAASQPAPNNDTAGTLATSQGALVAKVVAKTHGGGADFTLSVCNQGASSASRSFPTTDRYDFQVSRNGKTVWAYSHGHMHGNVVGSETWKPHECKTWTYTWDGKQDSGTPSPPGSYSVVGIMTSYSPQRTQPQTFCVYVC
jgi:hypothetical protein